MLKRQNQKLQNELDRKVEEILKLRRENQNMEIKTIQLTKQREEEIKKGKQIQKVVISKSNLKEIPQPVADGENKLSMFVSNVKGNLPKLSLPVPRKEKQLKKKCRLGLSVGCLEAWDPFSKASQKRNGKSVLRGKGSKSFEIC